MNVINARFKMHTHTQLSQHEFQVKSEHCSVALTWNYKNQLFAQLSKFLSDKWKLDMYIMSIKSYFRNKPKIISQYWRIVAFNKMSSNNAMHKRKLYVNDI